MKLRLAWLADAEDADNYSARESRVLLRAIARQDDLVPLWFAVGSRDSPHLWNGIRVFPVPAESLGAPEFLRTLLEQQRPRVVFSNLPRSRFPAGFQYLGQNGNGAAWVHRINPEDTQTETAWQASLVLVGGKLPAVGQQTPGVISVPCLRGLHPATGDGSEPSAVLDEVRQAIIKALSLSGAHRCAAPNAGKGLLARQAGTHEAAAARHLVMRQQLFCNASLAHVMFELTNALIELGVPTVPQDEQAMLSKAFVHREEHLLRAGAPEKHKRIVGRLKEEYDPENAIVVHFSMLKERTGYARFGVFQSLTPHEVLYTTGNHTMTPEGVGHLTRAFEMVLAPSTHVLRPYLEAGLPPGRGAVIPHGIDPAIFSPEAPPLTYKTQKRFKFVQTSFPWVYEKGFDLSVNAFCRAFTSRDDAALILRTPHIRDPEQRGATFGRLETLVNEAAAKPGAPEIALLELDVDLNRRGGIYTGGDCYLFPLRAEGFSMTILEAMACGLPVIATPWSGPADFLSPRWAYTLRHSNPIPERLRDGSLRGYHVEPDMDHLVHLMRFVYEHRDEAKALGRLASKVAHEQWTWKHAAAKLASVLGVPTVPAPPATVS